MSEWKDTTSYCRSDKKREPTAYTLKLEGLSITVTCGHIYHKPNWVMHCYNLKIDTQKLKASDLEGAKTEAIYEVKKLINFYAAKLDKF